MSIIWATRGRSWGFRFLRDRQLPDPLTEYDNVFSGVGDGSEAWSQVSNKVALRFPDPLGRKDQAGRVIPHDFVVFPPLSTEVMSIEDGLRLVWPLVAEEFDRVWDQPRPPSVQ